MQATVLLAALIALGVTVCLGVIVHELAHALVLHSVGVPYEITWLPGRYESDQYSAGLVGAWAAVTPTHVSEKTPKWGIRLSALAPLLLTIPFWLILAGIIPDPIASGNLILTAVTIGWAACALPSPQDFSVFWYANRAVATHTASAKS